MDNITTPDEYGGLWPEDYVSFIVMPAKKGVQAVEVTLEERSNIQHDQAGDNGEDAVKKMNMSDEFGAEETAPCGKENEAPTEAAGDDWDFSAWKS